MKTKHTPKIVTMCDRCMAEIALSGVKIMSYTYRNATTKPEKRRFACKMEKPDLKLWVM